MSIFNYLSRTSLHIFRDHQPQPDRNPSSPIPPPPPPTVSGRVPLTGPGSAFGLHVSGPDHQEGSSSRSPTDRKGKGKADPPKGRANPPRERANPPREKANPPKRRATTGTSLNPPKKRRMDSPVPDYKFAPFHQSNYGTGPAPESSSGPSSSRLHDVPPQVNPASQPHSQTTGITSGPSGSQHPPQVNPEV